MMMCQWSVNGIWLAGLSFRFGAVGCFARLSGFGFTCRARLATLLVGARLASVAWVALIARSIVQLAKRATKGFDLTFIRQLLALGEFDQFQNFFHLIHGTLECLNDLHHFVNRLADGSPAMSRFGVRVRMTDAFGEALDALN